jgi:DNA-binding Lrp family transcriptional regulator
MPSHSSKQKVSEGILMPSDQAVLEYLNELTRRGGVETCTASIPEIAGACSISVRQVQISTKRLIEAGLLERIGYDLSNADRTKRGTIYKVVTRQISTRAGQSQDAASRLIILLIDACSVLHGFIKQFATMNGLRTSQMKDEATLLKRIQKDMAELRRVIKKRR